MEHHAYLLIGDRDSTQTHLSRLLDEEGFVRIGNPDYQLIQTDVFVVDDARALNARAPEKAFGERKVFVIDAARFTPEAQNALLKTLEEPVAHTHFFIIALSESLFLPTLLSRLHQIRVQPTEEKGASKDVAKFLKGTPAERVSFAKKFADAEKPLPTFLDDLLLHFKNNDASADTLKKIFSLRRFAADSAASPRLILEHLALVL